MKKLIMLGSASIVSLVALVGLSHRNLSELFGYVRATADHTVEGIEDNVPHAIRDQKLLNDIDQARGEIIDRRVKLNLASSEIRKMQEEVEQLTGAVSRRETILAEAYPALEAASKDRLTEVTFAGTKWLPSELGGEIDRLLLEQDRDERQLAIRREALDRLVKSVEEGASAISQMESKLIEAENEFQALVVRRDQAENENELLDLVAAAGRSGNTAAAQIGANLEGLRDDVAKREARNEARRETVPTGERQSSRLTQAYDRLDRLKALHEKRQSAQTDAATSNTEAKGGVTDEAPDSLSATNRAAESKTETPASKNVIIVIKDAAVESTPAKEEK